MKCRLKLTKPEAIAQIKELTQKQERYSWKGRERVTKERMRSQIKKLEQNALRRTGATHNIPNTIKREQAAIISYLQKRVSEGKRYFKSHDIAQELNLSAKVVGTNLNYLADHPKLQVVKWSCSRSITWRVTERSNQNCVYTHNEGTVKKVVTIGG